LLSTHPEIELEVSNEGDGLQRLAQPHLVAQDRVHPPPIHPRQPIQPNQLVVAHLATCDRLGLAQDTVGVPRGGGLSAGGRLGQVVQHMALGEGLHQRAVL
jgi:hypothetical protein